MSIKYYSDRIKENSTATGTGSLVLSGAPLGYRTFNDAIGNGIDKKINYYIYRQDNVFEWEIGIGYISYSSPTSTLIREKVLASSNNNTFTSFTGGTKFIEPVLSSDRVNGNLINTYEVSGNKTIDYISAVYILDSSAGNFTITLPAVTNQEPISVGFLLNATSGNVYQQANAITINPNGTETIGGDASYTLSILNDYIQLISMPSKSGWLPLDPVQDATNPYGDDGNVQIKYSGSFSGNNKFLWQSNSLYIGSTGSLGSGVNIILPSSGTTVFNENGYSNADFRIESSGNTHAFFLDSSTERIGVGTSNPEDKIHIISAPSGGLKVSASGGGPYLRLDNTQLSPPVPYLGKIIFDGYNTSGNKIDYVTLYSKIADSTYGNEYGYFELQVMYNGIAYPLISIGDDQITFGISNTNIDGIILGDANDNTGNNILLGYYNSVCGVDSVVLGSQHVINSGSFGGTIGYGHTASGTNIWIVGGSGLSASGSGTYLVYDSNNYIYLNSGVVIYRSRISGDNSFRIYNDYIAPSGNSQSLSLEFGSSSKTGLLISNKVLVATTGNESTQFNAKILSNGSQITALSINSGNVIVGHNTVSGNNIVYGSENIVSTSGHIVYGKNITCSGAKNILFGAGIVCSGTGITIMGTGNNSVGSGDLGVSIFGNNNTAAEAYSVIIGNSNTNSGLYSVSCGYQNGANGDYSVSVGSLNTISNDSSVAVGRNNTINNTGLNSVGYAVGIGNTIDVSNTGLAIGYTNNVKGSGSLVFGKNCAVTGSNNIVIGDDVGFSGNNTILLQKGANSYIKVASSGVTISNTGDYTFNCNVIITGNLTVNGSISATSGNFTTLSADYTKINQTTESTDMIGLFNDWTPTVTGDIIRMSASSTSGLITGLISGYPLDGIILINVGNNPIYLLDEDVRSLSTNRFMVAGGGSGIMPADGGSVVVIRDKTDNRWRVL